MRKSHAPLFGPLVLSLFAIAFCVWTAMGNDVNLCVTTGCTLYADFSIAGISLWWFGSAAFTVLAACALLGQPLAGRIAAGVFLLGDICLLLLMSLTSPCVNCLVAAVFFALCYLFFRRCPLSQRAAAQAAPGRSVLLAVWLILFIVNLGQVARLQVGIWPILDDSGAPATRMFFSPSCKYCVEGINILSGKTDAAFYPVAENDADVARVNKMMQLLEEGENMADALASSADARFSGLWDAWKPAVLILRFRMLCNKAHIFNQGSQGVPFFEQKGLMPGMIAPPKKVVQPAPVPQRRPPEPPRPSAVPGNPDLPAELLEGAQCGGQTPCPPENFSIQ